jgi:hypothetical protein
MSRDAIMEFSVYHNSFMFLGVACVDVGWIVLSLSTDDSTTHIVFHLLYAFTSDHKVPALQRDGELVFDQKDWRVSYNLIVFRQTMVVFRKSNYVLVVID